MIAAAVLSNPFVVQSFVCCIIMRPFVKTSSSECFFAKEYYLGLASHEYEYMIFTLSLSFLVQCQKERIVGGFLLSIYKRSCHIRY